MCAMCGNMSGNIFSPKTFRRISIKEVNCCLKDRFLLAFINNASSITILKQERVEYLNENLIVF